MAIYDENAKRQDRHRAMIQAGTPHFDINGATWPNFVVEVRNAKNEDENENFKPNFVGISQIIRKLLQEPEIWRKARKMPKIWSKTRKN